MMHENENDADGILAIIKSLHQYVPFYGEEEDRVYGEQRVVGDQLSVERGVNGHMSLANGFTPEQRGEGLHFEIADWHAGNKFLEVSVPKGINNSIFLILKYLIVILEHNNNMNYILESHKSSKCVSCICKVMAKGCIFRMLFI
jgi:hypothetical protein